MKLFYQISQITSKGAVKYPKQRSRSFVKAYMYGMYSYFNSSSYNASTANISNTVCTIQQNTYEPFFCASAPGGHQNVYTLFGIGYSSGYASVNKNGIVVGTDNTAVTSSDYKLGTLIVSGTGTGQIEYFSNVYSDVVIAGSNASFKVSRIFRNASGDSITVREIGIYGNIVAIPTADDFMIIRDVLSSPVAMANGDYLKITYTFQITA